MRQGGGTTLENGGPVEEEKDGVVSDHAKLDAEIEELDKELPKSLPVEESKDAGAARTAAQVREATEKLDNQFEEYKSPEVNKKVTNVTGRVDDVSNIST